MPGLRRTRLLTALFLCGITATFWFGGHLVKHVNAISKGTYENVEMFTDVLALIQKTYVDEVTTEQLIEGAITGMLAALDPHSAYLNQDVYRELQVDTRGSFGGLGIEITMRNNMLTVVSPIEDTPAYRAGIQPGDQIIKIEDELTKDMPLMEAVKRMRGPKGTDIQITVRRENHPELIEVSLTREVIKIKSIKSRMLDPQYGYVRLTQFQERSSNDLQKALTQLETENGGPLSGLVLDLRNNPGGLLTQAVKVTDTFIDSGLVVYTDGRLENQRQKYFAHEEGSQMDYPMIVLVNSGSASASEIVAGALQDHQRALVLGTPTFGKGSVQTIMPVQNSSAIRLTTARYYTPNGRSIQATGITPDIIVEVTTPDDATLTLNPQRLSPIREKDLPGHFEQEGAEQRDSTAPQDPADEPPTDAAHAQDSDEAPRDPQLQRALELLKSWNVFKSTLAYKSE